MKFRYFLGWDGDILWPADEVAIATYGAPINYIDLPCSSGTLAMLAAFRRCIRCVADGEEDEAALTPLFEALVGPLEEELRAAGIETDSGDLEHQLH